MMNILITNDDGISSPALAALSDWAAQFGEVTVIAPKEEQSGKSHSIDFHAPIEIKQVTLATGRMAYSVASTPADCVRFGVLGLKQRYDLVLSGINHGYNLGCDIVYSGTVGAIFEAARQGIKGIALSTDFGDYRGALASLDEVKRYFDERGLLDINGLYNVNIPPVSNGIRITRQGGIFYTDEFVYKGNDMYMQEGSAVQYDTLHEELDIAAIGDGCISVTPLAFERTNLAVFEKLK